MNETFNQFWMHHSRKLKTLMYSLGIVVPASLVYVVIVDAGNSIAAHPVDQSTIRNSSNDSPQDNQLLPTNNLIDSESNEIHTTISSATSTNADEGNTVEASVTVNGQPIPVPTNGSTHQTVNTSDGNTDVNVTSSSSSNSRGSSTFHLNVTSSSSSKTESGP